MKIKNRIKQAIHNFNGNADNIDTLIAIAYFMGREDAAKNICDDVHDIFAKQIERANNCRYSKMAMTIQGGKTRSYSPDYAGEISKTFGDDETNF